VFYSKEGKEVARKLYGATDLEMDGVEVVNFYRARFQIEFLYRDAKQHCGLNDCQARSKNKLDFHFNAALTTVNLAKVQWLKNRKSEREPFSMANYKTQCNNMLMLELFIRRFAINPNTRKNQKIINQLCDYGLIAA
jgi:IS4 transposase